MSELILNVLPIPLNIDRTLVAVKVIHTRGAVNEVITYIEEVYRIYCLILGNVRES